MKKFFFLAALAGAALVSCTKNDPAVNEEQQLITFASPVVSLNTKSATEVWNNYPTAEEYNFAVWAKYFVDGSYENDTYKTGTYKTWEAGQTYMNEVVVKYGNNTWAPAQNYYWPKNGSLTFIAYAPTKIQTITDVNGNGIQITGHTVATTPKDQLDILFSERAYNKQKVDDDTVAEGTTGSQPGNANDPYTGVHLSFKHALSSILFNIKTKEDYSTASTTITLKKIEVHQAVSTGSFNQNLADKNGATTTDADATAPAWTFDSTPVRADYVVDNTANIKLSTTAYYPAGITNATAATNGLRATDLILLPQELDDVTLRVEYTIKNSGAGSEELYQIAELPLSTTNVAAWEMGKRYIYNIIIGLDTIYFEPYVQDWVDVDMGNLTI